MFSNSPFWDNLAIQSYKTILKRNPNNALAHHNLALVYLRTDQLRKARRAFQSAVRYDKTCAESHYLLGTVHQRLGDHTSAIRCFNNYTKIIEKKTDGDSVVEKLVKQLRKEIE